MNNVLKYVLRSRMYTKIFGRDQFFCLNFGRDQKLGEENEKGYTQFFTSAKR